VHGLSDILREVTEAFKGLEKAGEDYIDMTSRMRKGVDTLEEGINGLGDQAEKIDTTLDRTTKSCRRFRGVMGELSDTLAGRSNKAALAVGEIAAVVGRLPWVANQIISPLNQWTIRQRDLTVETVRGTAAIGASIKALRDNARAVTETSVMIQHHTGMAEAEATELASSIVETQTMLGGRINLNDRTTGKYIDTMSQTAKLTGMSASALGQFNRQLGVGLRLSIPARANIDRALVAANAMGVKAEEAQKTIMDGWDQMLAIRTEDREAFAKQLLEGASLISKGGIDFHKYSAKLLESRGMDAVQKAAMLAGLSGHDFKNTLALLYKAQHAPGDSKVQAEVLGLKTDAGMRVSPGLTRKDIQDIISNASAGRDIPADQVMLMRTLEETLGKIAPDVTGTTPEEMLGQHEAMDALNRVAEEVHKSLERLPADLHQMELANRTTDEMAHAAVIRAADKMNLFSAAVEENAIRVSKAIKVFDQVSSPIMDSILGTAIGVGLGKLVTRIGPAGLRIAEKVAPKGVKAARAAIEAAAPVTGTIGKVAKVVGIEIQAPAAFTYEAFKHNDALTRITATPEMSKGEHVANRLKVGLGGFTLDALNAIDPTRYLIPGYNGMVNNVVRSQIDTKKLDKLGVDHKPNRSFSDMIADEAIAEAKLTHPKVEAPKVQPIKPEKHVEDKEQYNPKLDAPPPPPEPQQQKTENLVPHIKAVQTLLAQILSEQKEANENIFHGGDHMMLSS
jgi:hypothetical protein